MRTGTQSQLEGQTTTIMQTNAIQRSSRRTLSLQECMAQTAASFSVWLNAKNAFFSDSEDTFTNREVANTVIGTVALLGFIIITSIMEGGAQ